MNKIKLAKHINNLCIKNLKSNRVKCCNECPFEDEIINEYPILKKLFIRKRKMIK